MERGQRGRESLELVRDRSSWGLLSWLACPDPVDLNTVCTRGPLGERKQYGAPGPSWIRISRDGWYSQCLNSPSHIWSLKVLFHKHIASPHVREAEPCESSTMTIWSQGRMVPPVCPFLSPTATRKIGKRYHGSKRDAGQGIKWKIITRVGLIMPTA